MDFFVLGHHGASRARGWRGVVQTPNDVAANNSVSNITAQLGGTAYLHCLVGHLSERGVSDSSFHL